MSPRAGVRNIVFCRGTLGTTMGLHILPEWEIPLP
jgi:hypothetical protein